jgi:glycine dehydrogenase subunit 1
VKYSVCLLISPDSAFFKPMPFFPNTDDDRREMLEQIGVPSFDDLLANIPASIKLRDGLALPKPLSEMEVLNELQALSSQNGGTHTAISFLGGGAYDHFIPSAVNAILSRSEFYTAYTPYQSEVSQGTLQAIYEFQTMISRLTGMDAANASMYDAGSALAEAALLAVRHTDRKELVIAGRVHPRYLEIVKTYTQGWEVALRHSPILEGKADLEGLRTSITNRTAAVIVQQPNFYGCLEDVDEIGKLAHEAGALYIVSVDPISLGVLAPPGSYGGDVSVPGPFCREGIPHSEDSGKTSRHHGGCGRQERVHTDLANEGAAHPEGEGDFQHLYKRRPDDARCVCLSEPDGERRHRRSRETLSPEEPLSCPGD